MSASERPLVPFAPVPLRYRYDGWTPDKQIAFIEALATGATVEAAARSVGLSAASARILRNRPDAHHFREAWYAAADTAMQLVEDSAAQRSIHGVARPVFYKGEQVGEWRHYDERLTMFLLRNRRRARFGAWQERAGPPIDLDDPGAEVEDDSPGRLAACCDEIAQEVAISEEDGIAEEDRSDGAEDAPLAHARVEPATSATSGPVPECSAAEGARSVGLDGTSHPSAPPEQHEESTQCPAGGARGRSRANPSDVMGFTPMTALLVALYVAWKWAMPGDKEGGELLLPGAPRTAGIPFCCPAGSDRAFVFVTYDREAVSYAAIARASLSLALV